MRGRGEGEGEAEGGRGGEGKGREEEGKGKGEGKGKKGQSLCTPYLPCALICIFIVYLSYFYILSRDYQ